MKPANNAPIYAGMYAKLAEVARNHGYALAVHGSMARDFDLVAVPWTDTARESADVVAAMVREYSALRVTDHARKIHGREVYTLVVSFDEVFLDLSFMPRIEADLCSQ